MTYFVKVYKGPAHSRKLYVTECGSLDQARASAVKSFRKGDHYKMSEYGIRAVSHFGNREHGVGISKSRYGIMSGFVTLINYTWYWVPNKKDAMVRIINPDNGKLMR